MKELPSQRARFGPFELDLRSGELCQGQRRLSLQEQPFRVLQLVLEHGSELTTREQIRKALWPNDTVVEFDHGINTAIKKIRQALGDSAEDPKYIETVARRGYRCVVPVEWPADLRPADLPIDLPNVSIDTPGAGLRDPTGAGNGAAKLFESASGSGGLAGKRFSHYRVLEILGGGGMGVVYKAMDLKLDRAVALKFLPEEMGEDQKAIARFEREARAVSALDHPNICPIYEFGEQEGRPFIVMPLLEGRNLRDMLADRESDPGSAFPIQQLLELAVQIASGLEAAHDKGIIHRDIKPANIFITQRGVAKILDFGIAKMLPTGESGEGEAEDGPSGEDRSSSTETVQTLSLTRTGIAVGSAGYMSPEQVRGEKLDARTDLFSFGLVLYEMVTGHRASTGDTAAIVHNSILNDSPTSDGELNRDPPVELEAIIAKALEKDRVRRYGSAREMLAELNRILRNSQSQGRQFANDTPGRSSSSVKSTLFGRPASARKKAAVIGVALVLIAGALCYAALWYRGRTERFNLENMQVTRLTANGKAGGLLAISPDGRDVALVLSEGGQESLRVRQVATGSDIEIVPPKAGGFTGVSFSPDGNYLYFDHTWEKNSNFDALYQVPSLGGTPVQVHPLADTGAGFSPDGKQIAFAIGDPKNRVWNLEVSNPDGSKLRTLADIPAEILWLPVPVWSPDGKYILLSILQRGTGQQSLLTLVSTVDGSYHSLLAGSPGEYFGQAAWLPDGRGLLVPILGSTLDSRGQIWFVSYPEGKRHRFTNDPTDYSVCCMGLTADGKTLAVTQKDLTANLWLAPAHGLDSGSQITSGEPHRYANWFSNSRIITQDADRRIVLMNPDGSYAARLVFQPTPSDLPSACGDGHYFVVYVSEDESGSGIWRSAAPDSGNPVRPVRLTTGTTATNPSCSPDGKWVVYDRASDKGYSVIRVSIQGGDSTTLSKNAYYAYGPNTRRISPDSKMVAVDSEDWQGLPSKLEVLALDTGTLLHSFVRPAELPFIFQWAPDGQGIDYVLAKDGIGNIWEQPLAGGAPKQLTHFASDEIMDFDWSPDGKQLLISRGHSSRNVFLLSNFR